MVNFHSEWLIKIPKIPNIYTSHFYSKSLLHFYKVVVRINKFSFSNRFYGNLAYELISDSTYVDVEDPMTESALLAPPLQQLHIPNHATLRRPNHRLIYCLVSLKTFLSRLDWSKRRRVQHNISSPQISSNVILGGFHWPLLLVVATVTSRNDSQRLPTRHNKDRLWVEDEIESGFSSVAGWCSVEEHRVRVLSFVFPPSWVRVIPSQRRIPWRRHLKPACKFSESSGSFI